MYILTPFQDYHSASYWMSSKTYVRICVKHLCSWATVCQRSPLMPSTTTPFCTSCACALFTKAYLTHPVQICVPCLIYCCSMHPAGSCLPTSIKLAFALLFVSGWLIAVHQASIWLCIIGSISLNNLHVHHASIWLRIYCASGIKIVAQSCASGINYSSMLCINVAMHHASLWLNAVRVPIYGPMLCIRHHNTVQTCASCINKARCSTSMTQALLHASLWLNTGWLITLNLPHHTCPRTHVHVCVCM